MSEPTTEIVPDDSGCICGDTWGPEDCPVHQDDGPEHCDCTSLCPMGPTCPGASLDLPGAGCWRTKEGDRG